MANNQLSNSTTVSGSRPCSTASHSSKVVAPLPLSCHASQTALAFQSNAAFTRALVQPTPPTVVREKDPSSLATPARLPELSPLCIPAVPTALSLPADTPSTTAVASPKSDSSHISKEPSSGSQEDGELEDLKSSDVEIFLSSLGLENAVPSAHTSTAPDSEHVPEDVHVSPTVTQQQKTANVSDDILLPQLPPAPLQLKHSSLCRLFLHA